MRKLGKKINLIEETIEAYACACKDCTCGCSCACANFLMFIFGPGESNVFSGQNSSDSSEDAYSNNYSK